MQPLEPVGLDQVRAAAERIAGLSRRTPLVRIEVPNEPGEIHLKLENLQPVGRFKVRGAGNALLQAGAGSIAGGVYTASAGNMAQGLAYVARRLGVPCRAIVPDHAPLTKLQAIRRYGAEEVKVPFDRWWQVIETHHFDGEQGRFVHPVCDASVIAGNATIGLEIAEDLPDVDAVVVPYGGGGLSCGIAAALRAVRPGVKVYAAEVETAAPLAASLAAGRPTRVQYTPTFVDGIGAKGVLPEMWPMARALLDGSLVVSLEQTAEAIRLLAGHAHVIAEGAGAVSVAAALTGQAGRGRIACVVSGGNIDATRLAAILSDGGAHPTP